MNKKQIYYLISRTLSLDFRPGKADEIKAMLPRKKEDWQKWVKTGSDHLVLQSLYLTLKNHRLLPCLPDELCEYLEYIYNLNLQRNRKMMIQARQIRDLLNKAGIDCIFMKGTGNIFDGLYRDEGERMVYDLDILVEDGNMVRVAEMLLDNGYRTHKKFDPGAYSSTMHYPILVKEDCVAGVEIHRLPVHHQYLKAFTTEKVFATKKPSAKEKGLPVMDDRNKIIHNFIHSQLMHNGHYHADVSLRDLYDLLLLSQRENICKTFSEFKYYGRKSKAYMLLMYRVFDLHAPKNLTKKPFFFARHKMAVSMGKKQKMVYHFAVQSFKKYVAFPVRTIWDKNTRNYVFSRLRKKGWYREHLNAYRRRYLKKRE